MNASSNDSVEQIIHALSHLHQLEDVFELTAIKIREKSTSLYDWVKPGSIVSGYYDDFDKAINDALTLDEEANAEGVYITLNPCSNDLLGRADNRLISSPHRTKDAEILSYRNLMIDIDPSRPSGVSSSEQEHEAAIEKGREIQQELNQEGWPMPMLADSGNGCHLIYGINLPNTLESTELIKQALKQLSERYSDDHVKIDEKVFNPSRLVKLYGTHSRKGDSIPDRPHRMSEILSFPDAGCLEADLIRQLAATTSPTTTISIPEPALTIHSSESGNCPSNFNLKQYLMDYGIESFRERNNGDSTQYILNQCLFDSSHSPDKASIVIHSRGGFSYQCFHDSCNGKTWNQVREKISGNDSLQNYMIRPPVRKPTRFEIISADDLCSMELGETNWIVNSLLPSGVTILAGRPKAGKSYFALSLAHAVASGETFLDRFNTTPGNVLYLGLEETQRRMKTRLNEITNGSPDSNLQIAFSSPSLGNGFEDCVNEFCERNTNPRLIVVDIFEKIKKGISHEKNAYQTEYRQTQSINELANQHDISIILIHHLRKSKGINASGQREDSFEAILGSTGLSAAVDTQMILERTGQVNLGRLRATGRDLEPVTLALEFSNCRWTCLDDPAELIRNDNHRSIIEILRNTGQAMKSSQISVSMQSKGVSDSTVRGNLRDMLDKGMLMQTASGEYDLVDSLKTLQITQHTQHEVNDLEKFYEMLGSVG